MRISDWSSDVCSSDLGPDFRDVERYAATDGGQLHCRIHRITDAVEVVADFIEETGNQFPRTFFTCIEKRRCSRLVFLVNQQLSIFQGFVDPAVEIERTSGRERVCKYG